MFKRKKHSDDGKMMKVQKCRNRCRGKMTTGKHRVQVSGDKYVQVCYNVIIDMNSNMILELILFL